MAYIGVPRKLLKGTINTRIPTILGVVFSRETPSARNTDCRQKRTPIIGGLNNAQMQNRMVAKGRMDAKLPMLSAAMSNYTRALFAPCFASGHQNPNTYVS